MSAWLLIGLPLLLSSAAFGISLVALWRASKRYAESLAHERPLPNLGPNFLFRKEMYKYLKTTASPAPPLDKPDVRLPTPPPPPTPRNPV